MSDNSSDCDSESENSQNDSEFNYITNYVFEDERQERQEQQLSDSDGDYESLYKDEPIADEEWLADYNREIARQHERKEQLTRRRNGIEPVESWCSCGNCKIQYLQNESECLCCSEIESCVKSLSDELVLEDVTEPPSCITLHPGFRPVCLEKWSLRTSADKLKCRDRTRYKQKGSESSFLRSVAYRAFTYMVHGFQGNNRIALPACAYHAIREQFNDNNEQFTGFEESDEEADEEADEEED